MPARCGGDHRGARDAVMLVKGKGDAVSCGPLLRDGEQSLWGPGLRSKHGRVYPGYVKYSFKDSMQAAEKLSRACANGIVAG